MNESPLLLSLLVLIYFTSRNDPQQLCIDYKVRKEKRQTSNMD